MRGLEEMMTGPQLGGDVDGAQEQERLEEPQDMDAFRQSLIRQNRYTTTTAVAWKTRAAAFGLF